MKVAGLAACSAMAMLLCSLASAQLTIDATGSQKESRKTSGGHVYGIGLRLPVDVDIEVTPATGNDKVVVQFTLTNRGSKELRIPMATNPEQVEPAGSVATYSFMLLNLYLTSDSRRERILAGGARLYGSEDSATLVTLAPGDSIRVLATVALPTSAVGAQRSTAAYMAHAMMSDETVTSVDGKLFRNSMDAGHASSREYTLQELLKLPTVH